jgi:hypothetical protein
MKTLEKIRISLCYSIFSKIIKSYTITFSFITKAKQRKSALLVIKKRKFLFYISKNRLATDKHRNPLCFFTMING